jgi:hypothetical protein
MLAKQSKRKFDNAEIGPKETAFVVNGVKVKEEKLERIKKRTVIKALDEPSPSASMFRQR